MSELAIRTEKRVSWVELFFDLVFVFAVTQVTDRLAHDPTWHGVLVTFVSFTPFWWPWVGTAVLANLADMDDVRNQLRIFAAGACSLVMTVAVPGIAAGTAVLFAVTYLLLRTILVQWYVSRSGWGASPFTWSILVTAPLLLLTAPLPGDVRIVAWAVIMVGEMASSWLLRRRLAGVPVNVTHMPERFGLVVIIALGESVVSAAAGLGGVLDAAHVAALLLCWVLACGLWWTYFGTTFTAMATALARSRQPSYVFRPAFAYGHYAIAWAIIAIAVAFKHTVHTPLAPLHGEQWLLCGGAALYLVVFTFERWLLFGSISATRAVAAVLALGLGLVTGGASGLLAVALIAALFAGLAGAEWWLGRRGVHVGRAAVAAAAAES